jgi:uncharacterized protein
MNEAQAGTRISRATWIGLFIALFGMVIARAIVNAFYPTLTVTAALWKESLIWMCVVALLIVIRFGEGETLRSVGIGRSTIAKSLGWGAILTVVCFLIAGILVALTHYNGGESGQAMSRLPLWLIIALVFRAGVVEELFYRGYAIERLEALGLKRIWAAFIPLLIFGVAHWTGGWANIVIALALGAVLTLFYMWRRDLVANMIAHFMVDFIVNVLPKLFA